MALPTSGQISISAIGLDMGILAQNISLNTLSTVNLNAFSASGPDGLAPHAISEFYGYDHSASSGLHKFLGSNAIPQKTLVDTACTMYKASNDFYSNSSTPQISVGDFVYADSTGKTPIAEGNYHVIQGIEAIAAAAVNFNLLISLDANGRIESITSCELLNPGEGGIKPIDGLDPGIITDPGTVIIGKPTLDPGIITDPGFEDPLAGRI